MTPAKPDEIGTAETPDVPVGGSGLVLKRHSNDDAVAGQPERLLQGTVAVLRAQVLQQMDDCHRVYRASG